MLGLTVQIQKATYTEGGKPGPAPDWLEELCARIKTVSDTMQFVTYAQVTVVGK